MKKLILFLIVSSLAWVLYAQAAAPVPGSTSEGLGALAARLDADIIVEHDAIIAAERAAAERAAARSAESTEIAEPEPEPTPEVQDEEEPDYSGVWGYFTKPGTTEHNKAPRIVEFGSGIKAGFGTNLIGGGEFLKKDIVIDLDERYDKIQSGGVDIGADFAVRPFYVNISIPKIGWVFGLFTNVDGRFDSNLPKDLFGLMANGNVDKHNQDGTFTVSGAVFAETGLSWRGSFLNDKLQVGIAPAYYTPLIYVPKSTLTYEIETEKRVYVDIGGDMKLYHVFSNLRDIGGGADISLNSEYALFPIVDVGGTISHIPIVPATLSNGTRFTIDGVLINKDNLFDGIGDFGAFKANAGESIDDRLVVRPLRFDFYTLYRPLRKDLLTIKPSIGFTVLNPSEKTYFNGVLEVQLHAGKLSDFPGYIFNLYLNTGIEEGYWRHKLGFALNFRALELDFEAGVKSQDYLQSYQASGMDFALGIKYGW
jgi:hypothetical protein